MRGKGCQEMEEDCSAFCKRLGLAGADEELISLYHTQCFLEPSLKSNCFAKVPKQALFTPVYFPSGH